jgi:hypothetical protein
LRVYDLDWESQNDWRIYPFNFTGSPNPAIGEIIKLKDVLLDTYLAVNGHVGYRWKDCAGCADKNSIHAQYVAGIGIILNISGTNSGHALSEMISFLNYFINCNEQFDWVAVTSAFAERNKFIFGLLCQFIPRAKIVLIKTQTIYKFDIITLRRNRWFNAIADWRSIRYTKTENLVHLSSLNLLIGMYCDSPSLITKLSKKLYSEEAFKYNLKKKVMMMKITESPLSVTPERAIHVPNSAKSIAVSAGFNIFDLNKISGIEEYICTLHHADIAIFSYGATACTNRFFLKETCTVILLANTSYKAEYDFKETDELWHPLHSHTFPVKRQIIWLDFPDVVTDADMEKLIQLAESSLTEMTDLL